MKGALVLTMLLIAGVACAELPDTIIMPHDLHFENDVECATCHEAIEQSTNASEIVRPAMDACADCHEVDDDDECVMCHTNPDEAGYYAVVVFGAGNFSHAAHLGKDMDCAACHGDPEAARPSLPVNTDCRACHETADAYADCRMCHAPDEVLRPADHDAAWVNHHGLLARDDQGQCAHCHTETTCQECHVGDNVRPRSHGLNYVFAHALDARSNELDCAVCHQDPEYCSACHVAERVLPRSHSRAGWVSFPDGGSHATDGLFEIESCIACHSEGSPTCTACHGG